MSKRLKRDIWDANSLVMGSGVGLATLEAMFNMVNTQSLLSANMVRDFELSHPVQMQALASAMSQIIAAGEYGSYRDPAPVDIPNPTKPGNGGTEFGAVPNLEAIKKLLEEKTSSNNAFVSGGNMDKHMSELLSLLQEHLSEIAENSKQVLAVT